MEIKAGEYVRLERGEIFKIDEYTTNYYNSNKEYITNEVVKHSKNIIDLIEVGDFVNGRKVQQVFIDPFTKKKRLLIEGTKVNWQGDMSSIYCEAEDIKIILTHEQYEQNAYRLEENNG